MLEHGQNFKHYTKRYKPEPKGQILWFHSYEISRIGKFTEKSKLEVIGAEVKRWWEVTDEWVQFLFGMMKKLWKWIVVRVAQHCRCT